MEKGRSSRQDEEWLWPHWGLDEAHLPGLEGFQWVSGGRDGPERTAHPDCSHPEVKQAGGEVGEPCRSQGGKLDIPREGLVSTSFRKKGDPGTQRRRPEARAFCRDGRCGGRSATPQRLSKPALLLQSSGGYPVLSAPKHPHPQTFMCPCSKPQAGVHPPGDNSIDSLENKAGRGA